MAETISLILKGFECLIFNLPPCPPTAHNQKNIFIGDDKISYPAKALGFPCGGVFFPVFNEVYQPARWHRLLWAVILGVVTLTLMFLGGLEAIRTVCIVAAFPLVFVIGLSVWSLLRVLKEHDSTAAEKLQAELIIPENWDVANALGAVTSHVLIRQNLTIRPDSRGRLCDGRNC